MTFSIDDIVMDFAEKDYAPERKEPKEGVYFEFNVDECTVKRAKAGHLMAKIKLSALDANGDSMFPQWINLALPVSVGDMTPPDYAAKIFLGQMRALKPENAAFDMKQQDPVSKKWTYMKGGEPVKAEDYNTAVTDQNRANGTVARDMAAAFIEADADEAAYDGLTGNRFFARVEKKGDFTNVKGLEIALPEGVPVVYERAEAFG